MHKENITEIVSHLQSFGLGLRRKTVEISNYNSAWATAFLWIKQKIEGALGKTSWYRTEHIGSTSIHDMAAKPILDIMITFKTEMELKNAVPLLENLGFTYKGDAISKLQQTKPDRGRHFFSFYDLDQRIDYIHLHMFTEGHSDAMHLIQFRDALRKSPALVQEYTQIKRQLKEDNSERHEYTLLKGDFVKAQVEPKTH
ncbi:MAG: GrpB family protein [Myxococcaceae bacterium]